MTTRTIIVAHEVELEQFGDLMDNVFRQSSPWVGSLTTDTDTLKVAVRFDGDNSPEGSFDEATVLDFAQLADAFERALKEEPQALCCSEVMLTDEIGLGCAQDADVVLQFAVLGGLIYG